MTAVLSRGALCAAATLAFAAPASGWAADDAAVAELRAELQAMKRDYETRIQKLEDRLAEAERQATRTARRSQTAARDSDRARSLPMEAPSAPRPPAADQGGAFGAITSGTAFNPQISVILDGNYYQDDVDGEGAALVGESFQPSGGGPGHEHGHADEGHAHAIATNGFNFREAEIAFTASVDPYFDAEAYLAVDGDGNIDLEEAFFQTRALPYGLRVKGGKFLSDFGYINRQHPHQWDFVDQNLPYLNLLGDHGLQDTGVQLTWLPELPVYTLLGFEALQGDQEIFGATLDEEERDELNLGDPDDGPRLFTAFAKVAPEIGRNQALRLGVSYAHNTDQQEVQTRSRSRSRSRSRARARARARTRP